MIRHVPNAITLFGAMLTSAAVAMHAGALHMPWCAGALLFAGQGCDVLDGWVARRYALETSFGAELDLLCDRVLTHAIGFALFEKLWLLMLPLVVVLQVHTGRRSSGRSWFAVLLAIVMFAEGGR